MKKYKIKVIAHQLKNQVIAVFGNEVNEDQLNGNADELVKKGFIELVQDSEKEVKTETKVSKK